MQAIMQTSGHVATTQQPLQCKLLDAGSVVLRIHVRSDRIESNLTLSEQGSLSLFY